MKRLLPFVIIVFVGLATMGGAIIFYRAKMQPLAVATPPPEPVATAPGASPAPAVANTSLAAESPAPPQEPEDKSLHVRGPRNAPVTLEIYGDFQCPSCAVFAALMKELRGQYGDKMREIFYEFPLAMHNHSVEAARAAEAAGIQGKFWEMHDMLYEYQQVWSKTSNVGFFFESYAQSLGLDVARFRADYQAPDMQQKVVSQGEAGAARGVKNTPTIFLNGTLVRANFTKEKLQEQIDEALAAKEKP
jgi:protein-disulfide isomerase